MASAIPDRWTDYKPIGEKIEGTRFIAFKVPLREHISKNVHSGDRLDGRILLEMVPNLGLIIDLTNTRRYYDPIIFENEGVKYTKIMIPGHETPSRYLSDKFIRSVKEFMENNKDNDKLIGVHCTHGVNRTGYLICNYMISQMNIEPNVAMDRFANSRGHKIERKNYIQALHKLAETHKEKIDPDIQQDNWREKRDHVRSDHSDFSNRPHYRPRNRYTSRRRSPSPRTPYSRERYTSWRRSPSPRSHYSNESGRNDSAPYHRPSDGVAKKPSAIPNEQKSRPRSHYSRESMRNDSAPYTRAFDGLGKERNTIPNEQHVPYRRPSNGIDKEPPTIPNEDQLSISKPPPYIAPHLRLDYYNTQPKDERQRCTSIRKAHDL